MLKVHYEPCLINPKRPAVGIVIDCQGTQYVTVKGQPKHDDLVLTLVRRQPYFFSEQPDHTGWLYAEACTVLSRVGDHKKDAAPR